MGASKPLPSTAYPTLAPSIKHISQSTIRKKWKPLPQQSQDKIRQILLNIRTKRSGHGGGGRITAPSKRPRARNGEGKLSKSAIAEEEYEKVVQEVSNKLLSRLPRMPFPPGPSSTTTAPDDFDLSSTLHRTSMLQAQHTATTRSSRLLRRQIQREKAALRRDKSELKMLEDGLRGAREVRRMKERGLHPLAREGGLRKDEDEDDDETMEIERVNAIAGIGSSSTTITNTSLNVEDDTDPELNPLLKQLTSHLLSMKNNTASMMPVLEAMDEAKLALDKFASRTLGDTALRRAYGVVEG